jgi:Pectate lyase superfamily protein
MRILAVSLGVSSFLAFATSAELIPAERLVDWTAGTHVGVIGGINQFLPGGSSERVRKLDVTQAPYNADNTGATDAQGAIQAAIDAAAVGEVVYLPPGTYRIDSPLRVGPNFSRKTLRGAGSSTIIDARHSQPIQCGSASGTTNFGVPLTDYKVVGGLAKGSTKITIGNTANFNVGKIIQLQVQNDPTLPVISVGNSDVFTEQAPVRQHVRVVAKTATTLSIWPPLYDSYGGGALEVRVRGAVFQAEEIGLEDFVLDCANTSAIFAVRMSNCVNSWIKGVEVKKTFNYSFTLEECLNCEIRNCFVNEGKAGGSNGAGILCGMWACLLEDNVIIKSFPQIEINGGSSGNVIAYNYSGDTSMVDTNHGPWNRFNLFEGNAFAFMLSDGYFGGESEQTTFRNYLWHPDLGNVHMRRWSRRFSVVGNILADASGAVASQGYPNMGNTQFDGTAKLSAGDPWRDYNMKGTLASRTSDSTGTISVIGGGLLYYDPGTVHNFTIYWGDVPSNSVDCRVSAWSAPVATFFTLSGTKLPPEGTVVTIGPSSFFNGNPTQSSYQERDLDVAATVVVKGNHYVGTNVTEPLEGDVLPDSLFRSGKPGWFGSLAWPPYNPANSTGVNVEMIPAGYRYAHSGTNPAGLSSDSAPPSVPQSVAVALSPDATQFDLTWEASTDNVGVTGYVVEAKEGADPSIFFPAGSTASTTFRTSKLMPAGSYSFRIRSIDGSSNISSPSAVVSLNAPKPKAPTNLRVLGQ